MIMIRLKAFDLCMYHETEAFLLILKWCLHFLFMNNVNVLIVLVLYLY